MSPIINHPLLIELAKHYTQVYGYPPCISKVCAYFMFDNTQYGVTFDELLQYFNVSKSSISHALKYLEEKKHIRAIAKEDCRKRYFVLDEFFLVDRYKVIENNLMNEQRLTQQLLKNFQDTGQADEITTERFQTIISILNNNAEGLRKAIQQLTDINIKSSIHHEHYS